MAVTIAFHPNKADILRSAYVGLRSQPANFALAFGFFVVLPWFLASLGIIVSLFAGSMIFPWALGGLIVAPPLVVASFAWLTLLQVHGARGLEGTHTYEFSETGIHLKGPGFDNQLDWAMLTLCYGRKQGVVFKSGNAFLISVPSHALSADKRAALQQLLVAKGVKLSGSW